ncbi:Virulence-associated V antigen [Vibrio harveyi]|uniref:virulence-associated V antigen n=1 Tax=Vibrio harveyi TaxID=669 RepID=UPI001EFEA176|nr:virulence-associated V antigen [Vibrio harveyi]MCG9233681.1 virulence-associated V antigen [Vibrio harveyi]MCG9586525.1 virulence-associated V antigen [Vibrio harveyi]CAH1200149.1 Virulence-associated V antigen [Vibrio harveyi]CAH1547599.1 Virulence-associated V antigen [Vibrio harveyi]CAH1549053.1 Virulence-associated V antigen [Vibrio harveyi]
MTDMTTMNSVSGVLNTATNRDSQASFQQRLVETLSPILGDSDAAQLESLIRQLPMVVGRTEQESLDLYADSLRTLLEKQAAFTGTAAAETVAHWMQSLQHQAVNGQIAPQDVVTGVNNTLAHQFQSWFDKQLKDTVDSSLPTDFINEFRLGSQSTQAQQIAALDASTLTAATAEISKFVDALGQQMSSSEVRDSAISFLRNAFRNLGSVDINGLKNSDYLLTQESFSAAVTAQLVTSLDSVGITLSNSDAKALADKIAWIPGMSKQELTGALNDLAKQVKGQYENAYGAGQVGQLQNVLNTVVANLKNSPNAITLSSLFSSIAVSLVNTQVDTFYGNLHKVQKYQATQDQVDLIKQNTARDINLLFEKIVARKDIGTDFITRHQKMMENLSKLNTRLSKISEEEKKITTGADGKEYADVKAEHSLTARDLLSVIESSIGDRFDERVLFSLNERRVNRLEKRNKEKAELEELTTILKLYSQVQALIGKALAEKTSGGSGHYKPSSIFTYTDFGYKDQSAFEKGPEFKYLESKITPNRSPDGVPYFTHQQFLESNGFTISTPSHGAYYDLSDGGKYLTNFSTSVSDKTKPLNNEVQLKTTALSDTSSQYNATVEAMNKFVQKYSSILQEILRAI